MGCGGLFGKLFCGLLFVGLLPSISVAKSISDSVYGMAREKYPTDMTCNGTHCWIGQSVKTEANDYCKSDNNRWWVSFGISNDFEDKDGKRKSACYYIDEDASKKNYYWFYCNRNEVTYTIKGPSCRFVKASFAEYSRPLSGGNNINFKMHETEYKKYSYIILKYWMCYG